MSKSLYDFCSPHSWHAVFEGWMDTPCLPLLTKIECSLLNQRAVLQRGMKPGGRVLVQQAHDAANCDVAWRPLRKPLLLRKADMPLLLPVLSFAQLIPPLHACPASSLKPMLSFPVSLMGTGRCLNTEWIWQVRPLPGRDNPGINWSSSQTFC